jgi:hypothetical protein
MPPTNRPCRYVVAAATFAILTAGCASPSLAGPTEGPTNRTAPATVRPSPTRSPGAAPISDPFTSASLTSYLASRPGQVTAALYDARTGQTWVYHPQVQEVTASIVKVEIMGTALQEAHATGDALPVSEQQLMIPMIEASDNTAASDLWARVGGPAAIKRFDVSAGLYSTTPSTEQFIPGTTLPGWGLTTTTAADQVALVKRFAYRNKVLTTADRQYGLNLMEHVEPGQNWGVSSGVGPGTVVALKNGWLPRSPDLASDWQVNSIGWVFGHGRNYVLAVLTSGSQTEAEGIATIGIISSEIYAELGVTGHI